MYCTSVLDSIREVCKEKIFLKKEDEEFTSPQHEIDNECVFYLCKNMKLCSENEIITADSYTSTRLKEEIINDLQKPAQETE